jgi:hypothetical protein
MKAALICPPAAPAVALLARRLPLIIQPFFGRTLLDYWLEHLAASAVSHVTVLASEHLDLVRALVRNGERWGLKAEVVREQSQSLTPAAIRADYRSRQEQGWLARPNDITILDHFPGLPRFPLFQTYPGWFAALQEFLPRAAGPARIGMRQLSPGVWVHLRARIFPGARLRPPCWIGDRVQIGPRCVVGPHAILEDGALVESDCEISSSVVGAQTFIGKWTEVRDSLAWGDSLLNWQTGSFVSVPDRFLMCAISPVPSAAEPPPWLAHLTACYARTKLELQMLWRQFLTHKQG